MPPHPRSVAFVTGASRGIGRLIATALAAEGSTVAGFARSGDDLDSLRSTDHADRLLTYPMDVTQPTEVRSVFAQAIAEAGNPTLLVTCAGSADALGPVVSVDPERWWQAIAVDLRGTMLCAQAVLPTMLAAATGRIITIYGNLGDDGREHVSAFASAKAGVARFTETLATELTGTGVTALCLHPGFVHTPMTEHLASSEAGRQWLPDFGHRARDHWGDGASAVALIKMLNDGQGDGLNGRIVHVGDDLAALNSQCGDESDLRQLRVQGV
jgi:NAD(P)-dependent dehydrogenase (short-subunit alcohol dehydrogenase family)